MARTVYAQFIAFFSTPEKADFAISLLNGEQSVQTSPKIISDLFGFPWPPPTGALPIDGLMFFPPYTLNAVVNNPAPSAVTMDGTLLIITAPGQPAHDGFPASDVVNIIWSMSVVVRGPDYSDADPTLIAPIPPRRWAIGWEGYIGMECHPNSATGNRARDASRVVDGLGLKYRGDAQSSIIECVLSNSEGTGLPTRSSWERFYVRLRTLGSIVGYIWSCTGTSSTASGARLSANPDGSLTAFNVNGVGVNDITFGSTPPLELNVWYKIDILVEFRSGLLDGAIGVYVNGVRLIFAQHLNAGSGLGQIQNHRSSLLFNFGVSSTWEIDLDDWHNAEYPTIGGSLVLNSIDWLTGTHIKATYINLGPVTAVNWTTSGGAPLPAILDQFINPQGSGLNLTSVTPTATIDAVTELSDFGLLADQENTGINLGPATVAVGVCASQNGGIANNGRLGYRLAGGAAILSSIQFSNFAGFSYTETYLPSGGIEPYAIHPFSVVYEKGPTIDSTIMLSMTAFCQYVGLWGLEDVPVGSGPPPDFGISILHNCRYPNSIWAAVGPTPDAPVCVTNYRYVGNGTSQIILGPSGLGFLPFQILVIRNTTTGNIPPVVVNVTMLAPESSATSVGLAGDIPIIGETVDGFAYFKVVGTDNRINAAGSTYEYFLFSDPALRYSIAGEYNHSVQTIAYNNPLIDTTFLPQFGMFFSGVQTPGGIWFKGLTHTGLDVSTIFGAIVSNSVQFAMGNLVTMGGLTFLNNTTAYSVFRSNDGSGLVMVQITSYVGDGTASRVINLTPASGRFPFVVFVTRHGGGQGTVYRDSRHTGSQSIVMSNGAATATGIIAGGIDTITVGITINAVGGEYDILCFPGTSSGWATTFEGTYCGPAGVPPGDFWEPDPLELPPSVGGINDGGLIIGGTPSLSLFKNLSGIYTLVSGKHTDTLYDRQTAQPSVEVAIPNPNFKTGYIGG